VALTRLYTDYGLREVIITRDPVLRSLHPRLAGAPVLAALQLAAGEIQAVAARDDGGSLLDRAENCERVAARAAGRRHLNVDFERVRVCGQELGEFTDIGLPDEVADVHAAARDFAGLLLETAAAAAAAATLGGPARFLGLHVRASDDPAGVKFEVVAVENHCLRIARAGHHSDGITERAAALGLGDGHRHRLGSTGQKAGKELGVRLPGQVADVDVALLARVRSRCELIAIVLHVLIPARSQR
jgi:hypothetical protein